LALLPVSCDSSNQAIREMGVSDSSCNALWDYAVIPSNNTLGALCESQANNQALGGLKAVRGGPYRLTANRRSLSIRGEGRPPGPLEHRATLNA
jgi:hypothetical protein